MSSGKQEKPLKLNLGCGNKILEGYVNVDIVDERNSKQPDVSCDVRDLGEHFEDDVANEVLAVHVLEHFLPWEVNSVLLEWKRVLKPGGRIIIEVPDLMKAIFHLLSAPHNPQLSMWALYGNPGERDPLMLHRWAYTNQSLATELHLAGFENIEQKSAQFKMKDLRDLRIEATKPESVQ